MNSAESNLSVELIRWTFSVTPEHRVEIETHLLDLGLEVQARGEDTLVVTWDEPEGGIDELIEELWAINGEPFEVTHEEFHRVNMLVYQPEETVGTRPRRPSPDRQAGEPELTRPGPGALRSRFAPENRGAIGSPVQRRIGRSRRSRSSVAGSIPRPGRSSRRGRPGV